MTSPDEKTVTVPDAASGTRLDKWLAAAIPELSRSRLKALIEGGAVRAAAVPLTDPAHKVKAGQAIHVVVPAAIDATPAPQRMELSIAYEDAHLIVVDKPAGLVVHPAAGNPDRTLVNALLAHCGPSLSGIGGIKRPGIVHRIDKDTSGLLVIAKTEPALAALARQFKTHDVERRYDALVWGVPRPSSGTIAGNIGRSTANRKKMAVVMRGGKPAETDYATVAAFGTVAAHIQCRLKTGRTHQIRVHLASKGHPIIGDQVYGRGRRPRLPDVDAAAETITEFPRQALHAATLGFVHPVTEKRLRFESPMPGDMAGLVKALRRIRSASR